MLCQDALESCCLSHNKDVKKESGQPNVGKLNDGILGKLYPVRSPLVDPQVKDQVNNVSK